VGAQAVAPPARGSSSAGGDFAAPPRPPRALSPAQERAIALGAGRGGPGVGVGVCTAPSSLSGDSVPCPGWSLPSLSALVRLALALAKLSALSFALFTDPL
jgi:hypothetical protein